LGILTEGDADDNHSLTPGADAVPIGPNECLSDSTGQFLNFGLVKKLGCALEENKQDEAFPLDINDPVTVACRMAELANVFGQELKRRRHEAGVAGPGDRD
jgi:hypothetical protein